MPSQLLGARPQRTPISLHSMCATILLMALAVSFSPANGQAFGRALLVASDQVLVGEADHGRVPGTVWGYRSTDGEWELGGKLHGPDAQTNDRFGTSLAQIGDLLFVGAGNGENAVVHIYRIAEIWHDGAAPLQTLAGDGSTGLGAMLAGAGDELLAVARSPDGASQLASFRSGNDGVWSQVATMALPSDRVTLAAEGDVLAIGLPGVGAGQVLIHTRGGNGEWSVAATLDGTVLAEPERGFGRTVAVHGGSVVVGGRSGAYEYSQVDGKWVLAGGWPQVAEADENLAVESASTITLGAHVALLGYPSADFGMGAVTVLANGGDGWAFSTRLIADHAPLPRVVGGEAPCEDGLADLYACNGIDLIAFLPREEIGAARGSRLNDVWGWRDPETGREYALIGRMDGTSFVEVTDPLNPRYLGNLAPTVGSNPSTWRDIKVYGSYAFVVADNAGDHGMQVFELPQLHDVAKPREFAAAALYSEIGSVHNIAINEETGFAYLIGSSSGGETCGGGSHIVDIRNPLHPTFAGCFAHPNTGRRGTGGSHDAHCVVYGGPDQEYTDREICVNSNETALSVADLTNKEHPVAIAAAEYPGVAYAHQGWFADDHRYFYSNDELDELGGEVAATRTLVWDLHDLDDPVLVREYMSPTRATDHNLYVLGDHLYMSNNRSGLRVLDIVDRENPIEIGYFDTTPWGPDEPGFDGTWSVYPYLESGTVLLSSRREGIFLVRLREAPRS